MHVELRVEARRDLSAGAAFYDHQRDGLGGYFLDCIFDDLKQLESEAEIHEVVHGLHCKPAKRFPFAIYYRVDQLLIDVVAILDCRQDPDAIAERLA